MTEQEGRALRVGQCVAHNGRIGKVVAHEGDQLVVRWSDNTSNRGSDANVWMIDRA